VTAVEFIEDAKGAVKELFRITKPGGIIVVATLNSLSPWADRRKEAGKKGHSIFKHAVFRSPEEVAALSPVEGVVQTAIHFQKEDSPEVARRLEMDGQERGLKTGAFVAARWIKPG
jgi:SAM-dependent methyltransferase